jgi:hypothetical protein
VRCALIEPEPELRWVALQPNAGRRADRDDGQAEQTNEGVDEALLFVLADGRRDDDQDVVRVPVELVADRGEQACVSDVSIDARPIDVRCVVERRFDRVEQLLRKSTFLTFGVRAAA